MLKRIAVNVSLTAAALNRIEAALARSSYPAMPALLYGRDEGTQKEGWRIGFYDKRTVEDSHFGAVVIEASGVELLFAQPVFLPRIENMQIDWNGREYVVRPPART